MDTTLKAWRERRNKMVKQAAQEAGVTPAMWSRWENGSREIPANRVLDIEKLTGISRHALRPDVFGPEVAA